MAQVVAISGGSGSGKSTLAAAIVSKVGSDVAAVLPLDAYYHDLGTSGRPTVSRLILIVLMLWIYHCFASM